MSAKTKSQLMAENTSLQALLAKLEDKLANQPTSESHYQCLFETAKDGILLLDANTGRITDVNPFLEDLLGYAHAELIGKELWEIGSDKDIAASQEAIRYLQNQDYIRYEDLPLQTKSGQHTQVEFISNAYVVDGRRMIQCNIRNITARKQAEARIGTALGELSATVAELQKRDKDMQLLNRMNELFQSCTIPAEAYQVLALTAGELFYGQNGCLAILQDQHLEMVARWGAEVMIESTFSLEDCWALRRGQLHEVTDPQVGLMCHHFVHLPQAGYLCLPLTVQGETLGMLSLINTVPRKSEHLANQKQLAVMVSEAVKLSLSNLKLREKLRQQATRDLLSGLFNRRYLDETLPRELHMAQRRNTPLSVVMLDLDHFKQFNDSFGHGPGDTLLREFGRILRENLRQDDIACRYGGDEFVLVMPDSSVADTRKRLEQIRVLVRELIIRYGEQLLGTITLSGGIAQAPEHGTNAGELLRAADEAMYSAKQAGRDRITIYKAKK